MSEGGAALMAVGLGHGEERARMAAEQAISSQLLDITIDGAHGILFNVTGGPDLTLYEVNQAAAIIKETAHPDVNLIFGAVIDQSMGDDVRVTVIATGFERTGIPIRKTAEVQKIPLRLEKPAASVEDSAREMQPVEVAKTDFAPRTFNTEDLDIPTFLRNRIRG
jgi:cell division protein FtsZ